MDFDLEKRARGFEFGSWIYLSYSRSTFFSYFFHFNIVCYAILLFLHLSLTMYIISVFLWGFILHMFSTHSPPPPLPLFQLCGFKKERRLVISGEISNLCTFLSLFTDYQFLLVLACFLLAGRGQVGDSATAGGGWWVAEFNLLYVCFLIWKMIQRNF